MPKFFLKPPQQIHQIQEQFFNLQTIQNSTIHNIKINSLKHKTQVAVLFCNVAAGLCIVVFIQKGLIIIQCQR